MVGAGKLTYRTNMPAGARCLALALIHVSISVVGLLTPSVETTHQRDSANHETNFDDASNQLDPSKDLKAFVSPRTCIVSQGYFKHT